MKYEDFEVGDEVDCRHSFGGGSWRQERPDDNFVVVKKDDHYKSISIQQVSKNGNVSGTAPYQDLKDFTITKKKNKPTMKTQISAIISGTGVINAVIQGKSYSIQPDSTYYANAKAALRAGDVGRLLEQFDLDLALRTRSNGKITLVNGVITYNGAPIHNGITKRIYELIRLNFPFEPVLKFLENVLKNPSESAREELYGFLELNALPITEDGHFLAWKKVTGDFLDIYTETMDNRPGKRVWMLREAVNANREQTCSSGLHVCSESYLSKYGVSEANTVVLVKVNPEHVVAVPTDYNNAKMRVCEYVVLQEVKDVAAQEAIFAENPVYSVDATDYGVKPSGQRYYAGRDSKGRFARHT